MSGKTILETKKSMYTENDNLDREQIDEYMKLSIEEIDKLIAEKEKEILKTPETMNDSTEFTKEELEYWEERSHEPIKSFELSEEELEALREKGII